MNSNRQAEIVFIDRWVVVQSYESFEAMQNALEAFQSKVAEQADKYVEAQQQMQQEAIESVLEASGDPLEDEDSSDWEEECEEEEQVEVEK